MYFALKTCAIYKQEVKSQIMDALKKESTKFTLLFAVTGVDFAGPFNNKELCCGHHISPKRYSSRNTFRIVI